MSFPSTSPFDSLRVRPITPVEGRCNGCRQQATLRVFLPGLTSFFHNPWMDVCPECYSTKFVATLKSFFESTNDWVLNVDMGTEPEYITTIKILMPNLSISMIR